ncbi:MULTISPECIES: alpha-glucosidase [unclassified Planococcus (in: firmicutes)]|uniref:alpha-glucosidase n=1 Tax=unclassified Planococcus (in: firmicutes) TaxID=2662419 RepID=UPI0020B32DD7|nr:MULTISPECIES: alpha-glucosidase [unclassified Planococcus (in: firmicutes)]
MSLKKTWWKESVVYQIYPRSFFDTNGDGVGDLNGVRAQLDYLQELGVDMIWLCPVYKSPNIDNGYDVSDYQAIMDEMGTMDDFDRLLEDIHSRGMKIMMDLVLNHTSDQHPWFLESKSSRDNPKRDWYVWRDKPTNWESIFGGPAWTYDPKTEQYYFHLFSKSQVDLNWENPELRRAIYDMILWWLDKGIDGFRVDAINHLKKEYTDMPNPDGLNYVPAWEKMTNVQGIQELLAELRRETFDRYDVVTVGEANSVRAHEIGEWISEAEGKFNMIFHLEAHEEAWDEESAGVDVDDLRIVLDRWQRSAQGIAWNSLYLENHDRPRTVSTWGNDREHWRESATALGCMYFFMQGTPFIYQGQEIGMTNAPFDDISMYRDIETKNMYRYNRQKGVSHEDLMKTIKKISRDHARTPMQWNFGANAGFTGGIPWIPLNPNFNWLNVKAQRKDPQSVLSFYKKMLQLRKDHEALVYGSTHLTYLECPYVYAYTREYGEARYLIISHLDDDTCSWWNPVDGELLLSNYERHISNKLQPYEARVYLLNQKPL